MRSRKERDEAVCVVCCVLCVGPWPLCDPNSFLIQLSRSRSHSRSRSRSLALALVLKELRLAKQTRTTQDQQNAY
jgi:hypothetical protein